MPERPGDEEHDVAERRSAGGSGSGIPVVDLADDGDALAGQIQRGRQDDPDDQRDERARGSGRSTRLQER